jgi:hypothetical protein
VPIGSATDEVDGEHSILRGVRQDVIVSSDDVDRAQEAFERLCAAHNAQEASVFRAFFSEDAVVHNHRLASFGLVDADGYVDSLTELWSRGARVAGVVERATARSCLVRALTDAVDADGGELQYHSLVVIDESDDGHIRQFDIFEVEQRIDAEAAFEAVART